MPSFFANLLFWLGLVGCLFYIRKKRIPYAVKHFLWLPEEKILWIDRRMEVVIQSASKTRYQTVDVTLTTQRLLFSQFGYYELIWDFTHSSKPAGVLFSRPYYCVSKEQIHYEKTFRGEQTLVFFSPVEDFEKYSLDLTSSEQDYASLFGEVSSHSSLDDFLEGR